MELIYNEYTSIGRTYSGSLSMATMTFSVPLPDQIDARFVASEFVNNLEGKFADQGVKLLRTIIWEDTSPIWTTDYEVIIYGAGVSPLAPVIIAALPFIIKGALLLLGLLIAYFMLRQVVDLIWGPPDASGNRPPDSLGTSLGNLLSPTTLIIGAVAVLGFVYLSSKGKKYA